MRVRTVVLGVAILMLVFTMVPLTTAQCPEVPKDCKAYVDKATDGLQEEDDDGHTLTDAVEGEGAVYDEAEQSGSMLSAVFWWMPNAHASHPTGYHSFAEGEKGGIVIEFRPAEGGMSSRDSVELTVSVEEHAGLKWTDGTTHKITLDTTNETNRAYIAIPFEVEQLSASGGYRVDYEVVANQGTADQDADEASLYVNTDEPWSAPVWLLPFFIGLVVGFAVAFVFRRKK